MAATQVTESFNTFASATLRDYNPKVWDQVFEENVILGKLLEGGRVREINGGRQISEALRYRGNTTVMSYSGADELDTAPQDNVTRCFYDWRFYNVAVTIPDTEIDLNQGDKHRLFALLAEKMEDAQLSIRDRLNRDLLAAQSGTNLDGLATHITESAGSLGSINGATETWWDNYRVTSGITHATLVAEMRTMYNTVNRSVSQADRKGIMFITSQDLAEEYEDQVEAFNQWMLTAGQDEKGFGMADVLPFKGKPIIWDEDMPESDQVKLINTNFLRMVVHPKRKFSFGEMRTPIDAHASTAHGRFYGNLVSSSRRVSGGLFNITAS